MENILSHKAYLILAIPFVISTITQPLLGAIDTGVVGHLSNSAYIGGVSIGTVIFNTIYWLFGFLRVSTSGFSAQALGAGDKVKSMLVFVRPMLIAMIVGVLLILCQWPIQYFGMEILSPEKEVKEVAQLYFSILIWGAPFVLGNYVMLGFIMGMAKVKAVLFMQVITNVVNILLDIFLVIVLDYGVFGVAIATLISQGIGFFIGGFFIHRYGKFPWHLLTRKMILAKEELKGILSCNFDLMIRTICLLIMTNIFTSTGARFGTGILAANALLFQIQYIMAYAFDGLANASSVFAGKAMGSKNGSLYDLNIKRSFQWSCIFAGVITFLYFLGSDFILGLFTNIPEVLDIAETYKQYLLFFPIFSAGGLVFYGVFTGTAMTKPVKNSMIMSLIAFFIAMRLFISPLGNHGLWISFLVFTLGRSVFLVIFLPDIKGKLWKSHGFEA